MNRFGPRRLTVDGEVFEITLPSHLPGQYNLTWVSGQNPGYGFCTRTSTGEWCLSDDHLEKQIRDFLAMVDPRTGYIE